MRYYKVISEEIISSIGVGSGGEEITQEEYAEIKELTKSMPTAPSGYDYALRADLTWELVELPPMPEPELTDEEALAILLGGAT